MLSLGILVRVTLTPYSVDNDWWMQQASQVHRSAVRGAWARGGTSVVLSAPAAALEAARRSGFAPLRKRIFRMRCCFCRRRPASFTARIESRQPRRRFARPFSWVRQSIAASAVYASADLMVLPSEYEPFAVVVNEAMCCGAR